MGLGRRAPRLTGAGDALPGGGGDALRSFAPVAHGGEARWHLRLHLPGLATGSRLLDAHAAPRIADAAAGKDLPPNTEAGDLDLAYLSCLPWLNFTAHDNAVPSAEDCIPRVSWGKIVPKGAGWDMAVMIQVHHAVADGRAVGQFFEATQEAFASLA